MSLECKAYLARAKIYLFEIQDDKMSHSLLIFDTKVCVSFFNSKTQTKALALVLFAKITTD